MLKALIEEDALTTSTVYYCITFTQYAQPESCRCMLLSGQYTKAEILAPLKS